MHSIVFSAVVPCLQCLICPKNCCNHTSPPLVHVWGAKKPCESSHRPRIEVRVIGRSAVAVTQGSTLIWTKYRRTSELLHGRYQTSPEAEPDAFRWNGCDSTRAGLFACATGTLLVRRGQVWRSKCDAGGRENG